MLLLSVLLLSGCVSGTVSCGIDKDGQAFLRYEAQVDLSDMPQAYKEAVTQAVDDLAEEYAALDFTVEQEDAEDCILLEMERRVQGDSYADAFEALRELLTDEEITPFVQVEMREEHTDREQYFSIAAQADGESIVKTVRAEELPADLRETVANWVEDSALDFTLELPGHTYTSAGEVTADSDNICRVTVPMELDGQASIDLTTRFTLEDGKIAQVPLEKQIQTFTWLQFSLLGAAVLFLIAAFILIIVKIVKGRKAKQKGGTDTIK